MMFPFYNLAKNEKKTQHDYIVGSNQKQSYKHL